MAGKKNRKADEVLLASLACGATREVAARQAGVSMSTVRRRMRDPEFLRQLQEFRADLVQRTAGTLTAAATEAVRALLELLKPSTPPASRLGAARSVLEIGMKVREAADLEQRLAALEQRLAEEQGGQRLGA
jgi:hypothetical protein